MHLPKANKYSLVKLGDVHRRQGKETRGCNQLYKRESAICRRLLERDDVVTKYMTEEGEANWKYNRMIGGAMGDRH